MLNLGTSADIYLKEGDEFLNKNDLVQASEKYYKAAEEAIKILAIILRLKYIEREVSKEGWNTRILNDAVFLISEKIDEKIPIYWASALSLITVNLSKEVIEDLKKDVEELVKIADREHNAILEGRG